jgi:hypothetical protein
MEGMVRFVWLLASKGTARWSGSGPYANYKISKCWVLHCRAKRS